MYLLTFLKAVRLGVLLQQKFIQYIIHWQTRCTMQNKASCTRSISNVHCTVTRQNYVCLNETTEAVTFLTSKLFCGNYSYHNNLLKVCLVPHGGATTQSGGYICQVCKWSKAKIFVPPFSLTWGTMVNHHGS